MKNTLLEQFIKQILTENLEPEVENRIQDLMDEPEYQSIEAFAEAKYEDDEEIYGVEELQALARNIFLVANPNLNARQIFAPQSIRDQVKRELESYGLKFIPRKMEKSVRGFTSPFNGSNRFAGNHGGSGFDNAFNREPDTKRIWSADDETSLRMHAKRK